MRTLTTLARAGVTFLSALLAGALTTGIWNLTVHGVARAEWTTALRLAVLLAAITTVRGVFRERATRACRS